jgi:uncharacterized Tic20 family protein
MTTAEELNKLQKMLDDGTITDEQYERARARLLEKQDGEAVEAELTEEAEPAGERRARNRRDEEDDYDRDERRPHRRDDYEDDYDDDRRPRRRSKKQVREYCMVLHLSLFAGHLVPLGGMIAPIVMWQMKKDEWPEADVHGKHAVNWVLTSLIYLLICIPLCFVIVGIPLLIVLGVLNVVFPVIAAMRANEGEVWAYPMTIRFFK